MDVKERLHEYHDEFSRWEKATYRKTRADSLNKKKVRRKRSVIYIDPSLMREMLDKCGLAATRIAFLILDQSEFGTNAFYGTYEEIEQELKISKSSVTKGIKELMEVDFIRKVRNSKWMLNPEVGSKCYAEDVNRLHETYVMLKRFTSTSKEEGVNDISGQSYRQSETQCG